MLLATRLQQLPVSKPGLKKCRWPRGYSSFGSATTSSCKGECCWPRGYSSSLYQSQGSKSVAGHEATAAPCIKARDRKRFRVCNDLVMQRRVLLATRLQQLPVSKQGLANDFGSATTSSCKGECCWPRGYSSSLYQSKCSQTISGLQRPRHAKES